jgi:3',5'-cyclic AMP phosphodiesterase CpdA
MRRSHRWLAALLCSVTATPAAAQVPAQVPAANPIEGRASVPAPKVSGSYSFVVLGHLRGDAKGPNAKMPELVAEVRKLRPAFLVLTGDAIWGDIDATPIDPASLHRQWDYIDSSLATVGVPVYRVPGNHDISDLVSRDVYRQRYGLPPQSVTVGDARLLLLSSAWIPADGDTRRMPYTRTTDLDATHKAWLKTELAKPGFAHTFVFMHHLLWWEPDSSAWWRDLHPALARAGVDAVFSGDYGPLKFSTMTRDSVQYFQSSIEDNVSTGIQRMRLASRILSSNFDNYLEVHVDGPAVEVEVHTVAEVSSGQFTPQRYAIVNEPLPPPPLWNRLLTHVGRKRLAAAAAGVLVLFGIGVLLGRASRRPA